MKRLGLFFILVFFIPALASPQGIRGISDRVVSRDQLSIESEEFCYESSKNHVTPSQIVQKVEEACRLLKKEGRKAFAKFMGKGSSFIFGGTYIWIHNPEGIMQMHPIKYKMEGRGLLGMKDKKGKRFFIEMNKVVNKREAGWVDYYWPMPGIKEVKRKVSYVKICHTTYGEKFIVGCGIYGLSDEEIDQLVNSK
jgi:signal transduction histidine kinase